MHSGRPMETFTQAEYLELLNWIYRGRPGFDYEGAIRLDLMPRQMVSRDNTIWQGQIGINDLIRTNMSLVFNREMTPAAALADLKARGDRFIETDLRSVGRW
jgi:hypothetical protein